MSSSRYTQRLVFLLAYCLLLRGCEAQDISEVGPRALACRVYQLQDHPWTQLPTSFSLQPTSSTWYTHIQVVDRQARPLACLILQADRTRLFEGQCRDGGEVETTLPSKSFPQNHWTDVSVQINQANLQVTVSGTSATVSISRQPQKLFLYPQKLRSSLLSYDCGDKCYFREVTTTETLQLNINSDGTIDEFFFLPLPGFTSITVEAKTSKGFGGTTEKTVGKISDGDIVGDDWHHVQLVNESRKLKVLLSGRHLNVEDQTWSDLRALHVTVTGPVRWSVNCRPSPPPTTTITATTTTTTTSTSSTVLFKPTINNSQNTDDEPTVSSAASPTDKAVRLSLLYLDLVLTLFGVGGSVFILVLTCRQ